MTTFSESVTMSSVTCGSCAGVFALNKIFLEHARSNRGNYTCPYCKTGWSWSESEADRLRSQIETKERELRESKCETLRQQHLLEAEQKLKSKLERKLRRVGKGVCPDCQRSFSNLARHMATKHANERHP